MSNQCYMQKRVDTETHPADGWWSSIPSLGVDAQGCHSQLSLLSLSHQPIAQVPARTDLDYAVRLLANPLKQKSQTSSVSRQMLFFAF